MEDNTVSVFKSYLRMLLEHLKELQRAVENKDEKKIKEILDKLIKDTQSGIED